MPRTNDEVADALSELADLLALTGYDPFRVRAYEKAAQAVAAYAKDVATLDDKELLQIPTIGKGMAGRIRAFLDTGAIPELEDLRAQVPPGLRELTAIPGLGPKKAQLLNSALGITTIAELVDAVEHHKLRDVKGLGAKTEENILRGIQLMEQQSDRTRIDLAIALAEELLAGLRGIPGVVEATTAGSLRRMRETIGDIDLLCASAKGEQVMQRFLELSLVGRTIAKGETKLSIITLRGMQVDLRVVPPDAWGAALIYFTGSKDHNIKIRQLALKKGLTLNEYGLFKLDTKRKVAARTEEIVYGKLGLPWIPPTMREDSGEVEAALAGDLITPVTEGDLTGDLHTHTDLTDGKAPLEEMLEAAAKRGLEYYAVTDHAEGLPMMGMSREKALAQRKKIQSLRKRYPAMEILHGMELNIAPDGAVDYDAAFLCDFDWLVASVHSHFTMPRDDMTKRIITAMENPDVHAIGHPSGRLIGKRPPIDFDEEAVFEAAAETGTALEINCFPDRQDLRADLVRRARERGVTFTISTDAHSPVHFANARYGVAIAQRGWLTADRVLNCRPLDELRAFVARKRSR